MEPRPTAAEVLSTNRAMWDESVAIHFASDFYGVEEWLTSGRGPGPEEVAYLGSVEGLTVVHLQCHFGMDTLSLARAGAIVTGLDFSPRAVDQARALATAAGLDDRATFAVGDASRATDVLEPGAFDLVYVTLGSLCWLPSVAVWAEQVAALLRPGGRLYCHDVHPFSMACGDDGPEVVYSYFETTEPVIEDSPDTYTGATAPLEHSVSYSWNHSLGEIVEALLGAGMVIDALREHAWTAFERFPGMVRTGYQRYEFPPRVLEMPLSFTVCAQKNLHPQPGGAAYSSS